MTRYIDVDKAYDLARTDNNYSDFGRSMADLTSLRELLDDTPTADVAPVVHGKWVRYDDVQEESVKYICSNCGDYHAFRKSGGSPFLTSKHTFNENYIYCRKCGSRNGGFHEQDC